MSEKHDLFGLKVSACEPDEVLREILQAGRQRALMKVAVLASHGVIESCLRPDLRRLLNEFDIVAPDGQPVRWALNYFYRAKLKQRVYGPHLMEKICELAPKEGLSIFLYGNREEVLENLSKNLARRFVSLKIVGQRASVFRALTQDEIDELLGDIRESGAQIVFVGIGCPNQEKLIGEISSRLPAVWIGVGAAFDFLSGAKRMAPRWMQNAGLEWFFRFMQEPRRLAFRYIFTNTLFIANFLLKASGFSGWRRN